MRRGKGLRAYAMDGSCDVTGCTEQTYMGWRPLTERLGRKICEQHWRRHKDEQDSFDLFEEFGFKRPAGITKPKVKKDIDRCACGREHKPKPVKGKVSGCRDCGGQREPGHSYCKKCGQKRKAQSNRRRQQRHYSRQKPNAFVQPLSQAVS